MDKSEANFDPGGQSQELRSDSRKTLPVSGEPGGAENSGGKSSGIYVELNQYKQEVRYLKGRIQGYQMLSSLLHQAKQEATTYRQLYAEAASQLDGAGLAFSMEPSLLLSSLNSATSIDSIQKEEGEQAKGARDKPSGTPGSASEGGRSHNTDRASLASENEEPIDMETNQIKRKPQPQVKRDLSDPSGGGELRSASPDRYQSSLFEKMDLGMESLEIDPYDQYTLPGVTPLDSFSMNGVTRAADDRLRSQQTSSSIEAIPSGASSPTGAHLITQVQEISDALTRGVGLTAPSQLSIALARLAFDVLKVEKQMRLKQVMINNLCPENEQLKSRVQKMIADRDSSIKHLKDEKETLEKHVADLKNTLREFQGKSTESGREDLTKDWVHVQRVSTVRTSATDNQNTVEPQKNSEVTRINQNWEKRMQQVKTNYETTIAELRSQIDNFQRRLIENEQIERQRQDDIDKLLLFAKDRTEKEKKSKDEVLRKLQIEQEQRQRAEENVLAERRNAEAMADRVLALQLQLASFTDASQANIGPVEQQESLSSLAVLTPAELRTQIQILRQQATIYKEDFDRERLDRERIQVDRDTLQNGIVRLKADLTTANEMVRRLEQEAELLRTENSCLRQGFQEIRQCDQDNVRLRTENMQLREQLHQRIDQLQTVSPANVYPPSPAPLGEHMWTAPAGRTSSTSWKCPRCTYINIAIRTTCEMCGFAHPSGLTTRTGRLISHGGWIECDQNARGHPPNVTMGDDLVIDNEDQPDAPLPT